MANKSKMVTLCIYLLKRKLLFNSDQYIYRYIFTGIYNRCGIGVQQPVQSTLQQLMQQDESRLQPTTIVKEVLSVAEN